MPDDVRPSTGLPTGGVPAEPQTPIPSEPIPSEAIPSEPIPSEAELERTATPATVRRAPKYSAFIVVGALVGILLGVLATVVVEPDVPWVADGTGFISFLDGAGTIRFLCGLAGGVLGGFVGGALAVAADRRSRAR